MSRFIRRLSVIPLTVALSSCAVQNADASSGPADLGWLWGLIGVIALFVLGGVVYRIRHPQHRDPGK